MNFTKVEKIDSYIRCTLFIIQRQYPFFVVLSLIIKEIYFKYKKVKHHQLSILALKFKKILKAELIALASERLICQGRN